MIERCAGQYTDPREGKWMLKIIKLEIRYLYFSPNIMVARSTMIRCTGHMALMGEMNNSHGILSHFEDLTVDVAVLLKGI